MADDTPFSNPHIVLPLGPSHTHTIVLLHGRGSHGEEFAEELFEARTSDSLSLREHFPTWKWIFPTSRTGHSTVFQEEMNEWFDIYSLTDPDRRHDLQVEGLKESMCSVRNLIASEVQVVSARRVLLGGISQGCAVGLHGLLAGPYRLGAFVGFCCWLPFQAQLEALGSRPESNPEDVNLQLAAFYQSTLGLDTEEVATETDAVDTPVFLSHATDDDVVDVDLGRLACATLRKLQVDVAWTEYATGGHWITEPDGFDDLVKFLEKSALQTQTAESC